MNPDGADGSMPTQRRWITINTSRTRYHVVRAAALELGWIVDDTPTSPEAIPKHNQGIIASPTFPSLPAVYHGVDLNPESNRTALAELVKRKCVGGRRTALSQVIWVDTSILGHYVAGLLCYQRVNHFPSMHLVARKAVLFPRLMRLRELELTLRSGESGRYECKRGSSTGVDDAAGRVQVADVDSLPLFSFFPPSFSLRDERAKLQTFIDDRRSRYTGESGGTIFIVKPNKGCCGKGIYITANPLAPAAHSRGKAPPDNFVADEARPPASQDDAIVQLYINRPLLIEGRKFDMRVYVLVTSVCHGSVPAVARPRRSTTTSKSGCEVGNAGRMEATAHDAGGDPRDDGCGLRIFVHRQGLVRMCVTPYQPIFFNRHAGATGDATPPEHDYDVSAHLTNYSLNKKHGSFRHADDAEHGVGTASSGHKRDFSFLKHFLNNEFEASSGAREEAATPWDQLWQRIDECIVLTLISAHVPLKREFIGARAAFGMRSDARNCFELLGFDIFLTKDLLPLVLEVNHSPSLLCDSALDFHVKKKVVRDTLQLLEPYLPNTRHCDEPAYVAHQQEVRAKGWSRRRNGLATGAPLDPELGLIQDQKVDYRQIYPLTIETATIGSKTVAATGVGMATLAADVCRQQARYAKAEALAQRLP